MEKTENLRITVTLRTASKPGSVKAHADVRVDFPASSLEVFGVSIVQHDSAKPAWVSYPQRADKNGKKYFSIVKLTGVLHDKICSTVLSEFERIQTAGGAAVPRAQIPAREPGDDIPF